jgi:hypothetical protein
MTLFDFEELAAYWAEHPPVHILVGAYLGIGKDTRKPAPSMPTGLGRETGSDLPWRPWCSISRSCSAGQKPSIEACSGVRGTARKQQKRALKRRYN